MPQIAEVGMGLAITVPSLPLLEQLWLSGWVEVDFSGQKMGDEKMASSIRTSILVFKKHIIVSPALRRVADTQCALNTFWTVSKCANIVAYFSFTKQEEKRIKYGYMLKEGGLSNKVI